MNQPSKDIVSNRKAFYNYEILDTYEAGLVLMGTEVKSLRMNGGSLQEAYVKVLKGEVWLVGASIPPYRFGNVHNHEERRERKLLMHHWEIERLARDTQQKGLTIAPLALYFVKGRVKIKIGLARGKKAIDKRETIKERDEKRRVQAAMKNAR